MHLPRAVSLVAILTALLACLLAGCGGNSASTTTPKGVAGSPTTSTTASSTTGTTAASQPAESDPEQIIGVIDAVLSSPDSEAVCTTVITPQALEDFYGGRQACLNGRPKATLAKSAAITDVLVSGDHATAKAKPKGGLYDGVTVKVSAVRGPDGWQIDGLDAKVPVGP